MEACRPVLEHPGHPKDGDANKTPDGGFLIPTLGEQRAARKKGSLRLRVTQS
jgi:hypothetical protein